MKLFSFALLSVCLATGAFAQAGKTHLKVGDAAPEFSLPSTTGKPIALADYKGKTPVVLSFFPAAFTGGCTKEMTGYQAGISKFKGLDVQVIGISTDNAPTLSHWSKELGAEFPMVSDFLRKTSTDYGVLIADRGIANRTTFVIGTDGKIAEIIEGTAAIDITNAETACSRLKK